MLFRREIWDKLERQFECIPSYLFKRVWRKKKITMKIRDEIQEYPNKPLKETLMDKLKDDNSDYKFIAGLWYTILKESILVDILLKSMMPLLFFIKEK